MSGMTDDPRDDQATQINLEGGNRARWSRRAPGRPSLR